MTWMWYSTTDPPLHRFGIDADGLRDLIEVHASLHHRLPQPLVTHCFLGTLSAHHRRPRTSRCAVYPSGPDAVTCGRVSTIDHNDEYMARLRPLLDRFSDQELERLCQGDGPRLYVMLDDDQLPTSAVIYDPSTGRREAVWYPGDPAPDQRHHRCVRESQR